MLKFRGSLLVYFVTLLLVIQGFLVLPPSVLADGLEIESAAETLLDAPPPPSVEGQSDLFLPPEPEEVLVEIPEPTKEDLWPSVSSGMILLKPVHDGHISASEDRKEMLSHGDVVYLKANNEDFSPGQEWVVFKTMKKVHHPKTGEFLGELVHVLGMTKVIDVDKNVATAKVTRSKAPMSKGDRIAFIESFVPLSAEQGLSPEKGAEAFIVEGQDGRKNNAQHDIVYIDQGKAEGIAKGDQFIVIHEGIRRKNLSSTALDDSSLPYRKIGTMVVLATQAHTATAKITQSLEPIAIGDTILFDAARK